MGQYTKEMHEAYRKEQDEKAAKEAQERDHRRQRMERANARRAYWLMGARRRTSRRPGRP